MKLALRHWLEDIVTLAASAKFYLTDKEKEEIDMVIVATESIDQSKAAAVFVWRPISIQPFARFEIKEACGAGSCPSVALLYVEILSLFGHYRYCYGVEPRQFSTCGAGRWRCWFYL